MESQDCGPAVCHLIDDESESHCENCAKCRYEINEDDQTKSSFKTCFGFCCGKSIYCKVSWNEGLMKLWMDVCKEHMDSTPNPDNICSNSELVKNKTVVLYKWI